MSIWRRSPRPKPHQQPNLPGLFTPPTIRRLATPHDQAIELARGRLIVAGLIFLVAFTVLIGKTGYLTLFGNESGGISAAHRPQDDSTSSRADITDRNGVVLATSLPTQALTADTKGMLNMDGAAHQLKAILPDLDEAKLKTELHAGKRYVQIHRHLTPKQCYDINTLGITGLEFHPEEHRIYPVGNLTAHVVGYTDVDNNGLAGIEKSSDQRLQEQAEPLTLSLDLRLQSIMHDELSATMASFHALGASGLIMDSRTGEILSLVSLPDFDPQHAGDASDDAKFNRATLGVYEMGSTFKIFTTALGLDSGLVHIHDTFDTIHPIEIGHQKIRDFERETRWLNVAEIFTHSSNIGASHMAQLIGGERERNFFGTLGLMQKEPLEIPEVGAPILPPQREWSEATTMTVAFGHGISVNAVQLVSAVATIINDGKPVHPTLIKRGDPNSSSHDDLERPVISAHTSSILRALMRLVVTHGTAKAAEVAGYLIGGKTGTAEKLKNGHYDQHARMSSFIGAFPLNAPRYIVFAMLDDPKGNASTHGFATGGWTAAPAVGRIVTRVAPLLDLAPLPAEKEANTERQILKPLGAQILDGLPVDEDTSNYASVEANSVEQ